jgi:hypothetical protein
LEDVALSDFDKRMICFAEVGETPEVGKVMRHAYSRRTDVLPHRALGIMLLRNSAEAITTCLFFLTSSRLVLP